MTQCLTVDSIHSLLCPAKCYCWWHPAYPSPSLWSGCFLSSNNPTLSPCKSPGASNQAAPRIHHQKPSRTPPLPTHLQPQHWPSPAESTYFSCLRTDTASFMFVSQRSTGPSLSRIGKLVGCMEEGANLLPVSISMWKCWSVTASSLV